MPNINITVAGKIATNTTPGEIIVCGNSDYTVTFDFDNEWRTQTKRTARFVYYKNGQALYKEAAFTGNTVAVPVLSGIDFVLVGVYAGNLITTTPAKVLCDRSILCGDQLEGEGLSPEQKATLQAQIGDLSQLRTVNKADLVAAINEIHANAAGEITVEQIAQAVEDYLEKNPVSGEIAEEQIAQAVEDYLEQNPIECDGAPEVYILAKGETLANVPAGISIVVNPYEEAPAYTPETGGSSGGNVTAEQVAQAVESYMEEHPAPAGPQGETGPAGPQGPEGPQGEKGEGIAEITEEIDVSTGKPSAIIINMDNGKSYRLEIAIGRNGTDGKDGAHGRGVFLWDNSVGFVGQDEENPGISWYTFDGIMIPDGADLNEGSFLLTAAGDLYYCVDFTMLTVGVSFVGSIKGPQGPQGPAGATPVKGVDYFTDEDKAEFIASLPEYVPAVLTSDFYGDELPAPGTPGRIFFKKVSS
jgi:hypothetical protein